MITSSPTRIGSRKSTWSTAAVTHGERAWRIAETAAALSIIARMVPPKTWPRAFSSDGIISAEVSCFDSRAGPRLGNGGGGPLPRSRPHAGVEPEHALHGRRDGAERPLAPTHVAERERGAIGAVRRARDHLYVLFPP